jgi:hypothetical protein
LPLRPASGAPVAAAHPSPRTGRAHRHARTPRQSPPDHPRQRGRSGDVADEDRLVELQLPPGEDSNVSSSVPSPPGRVTKASARSNIRRLRLCMLSVMTRSATRHWRFRGASEIRDHAHHDTAFPHRRQPPRPSARSARRHRPAASRPAPIPARTPLRFAMCWVVRRTRRRKPQRFHLGGHSRATIMTMAAATASTTSAGSD